MSQSWERTEPLPLPPPPGRPQQAGWQQAGAWQDPAGWQHGSPPPARPPGRWVAPVLVITAIATTIALVAVSVVAVQQRAAVAELEAQVAALEARLAEDGAQQEGLGGLLEDLLGGGGDLSDLGDLFGGGGADGGDLGDLFGEGGLGDLFGEGGLGDLFGEGGLDGLLGGDLLGCLTGGGTGGEPVPDGPAPEQVDAIAERVEDLRELEFTDEVATVFQPSAEFEAGLLAAIEEGYSAADADIDRRLLAALGAVEADADLRQLQLDLVTGQAAGYYDTDTAEIVVRAEEGDAALGAVEQIILAHELEHALADQVHGLPTDDDPGDSDGALASLSLIEGDASLAMQHFSQAHLGFDQQLGLATDPALRGQQEQLRSYPHLLQRQLIFPYQEGLAFACNLYDQGGWPAIDAAYAAPPTSSAQILDPARYAAGETPTAPQPLAPLPAPWSQARADTFGAAPLQWLFEAPGDDPAAALDDPATAAAAWAGGSSAVWTDGDRSAVGLALVDSGGGLCDAVSTWYGAAFAEAADAGPQGDEVLAVEGAGQDGVLSCQGDQVRLGIGPDLATARALVDPRS